MASYQHAKKILKRMYEKELPAVKHIYCITTRLSCQVTRDRQCREFLEGNFLEQRKNYLEMCLKSTITHDSRTRCLKESAIAALRVKAVVKTRARPISLFLADTNIFSNFEADTNTDKRLFFHQNLNQLDLLTWL